MTAILFVVAAVGLWALYLMYCTLHASMKSGKFYETPWPVRVLSYSLLVFMVTADIAFNVIFGSAIFVELPNVRALTFTARCSGHMGEDGWRGDLSRWICRSWLNPFESDHCRP
jgi:hypothetical protein